GPLMDGTESGRVLEPRAAVLLFLVAVAETGARPEFPQDLVELGKRHRSFFSQLHVAADDGVQGVAKSGCRMGPGRNLPLVGELIFEGTLLVGFNRGSAQLEGLVGPGKGSGKGMGASPRPSG